MATHAQVAQHSPSPSNMDNFRVEYSVGYQGSSLHITEDHSALAISGNSICSYSLQGGPTKPILWGPRFGISVSAYHFEKKRIAFAEKGLHPSVYVYKTGSWKLKCKISDIAEVEITAIAFSKDGSRLVTVSSEPDFRLCLWDIRGEEPSKIAEAHLDWVAQFASFNPTSNDQVCLSGSGRISVWTYEFNFQRTSFPCKAFSVKPHEPNCHAWSEDGKKIYVGCLKGELLVLKPAFTPEVGVEDDEDEDDRKSSFEELIDGDVKTPVADDTTTVIGNEGWHLLKVSKPMDKIAAISVGHLHMVISDVNGHVCWLSLSKRKEGDKVKIDNSEDAEASETDSTTIGSEIDTPKTNSTEEKHATIVDSLNTNNTTLEHEAIASILFSLNLDISLVTNISYTDDQAQLLVGSASGSIVLIRMNKNALEASLSTRAEPLIDQNFAIVEWRTAYHHGPVLGFASLGDGRFVLTCGQDGSVRVWEADRGKEISRHCFNAAQLCIDSHERTSTAVTGSINGTICIFKVDSMGRSAIVSQNKLDTSPIDKVSFNKDSHHLVVVCKEAGKLYFLNSGSSDLDELELLGYTLVDDVVHSVAWDIRTTKGGASDVYLLLSLARGEIARIMVPLSRPQTEDLFLESKTLNYISFRTQVPLLSIVVGKYYLEKEKVERKVVWGMGQDKKLQQYRLPENAQGWTGTGGTALHAHFNMPGHAKVGSALVLHLQTSILITAAEDGALQIRDAVLDPLRQPQKVVDTQLYDGYLGGITCVIVAGNQLFIGGANGVIICAEAPTVGLKIRRTTSIAAKARISIIPETTTHDSSMDGALSGQLSMLQKYEHTGPRASVSGMQYIMELRKNVQKLRQEFHDLVEKNEKSPLVEKLVRSELIVDMDLERELRSQGERRVVTVREEVIKENLKKDIMVRRIKEECRKVAAETGKHIWPFIQGSKVPNFPLHDKNCSRSRAAHVAKTFRIIELQEHEYTKTLVINNDNELPAPPQSSHSTISEMVTEGDLSTRSKETIVPVKELGVETSQKVNIVEDKSSRRSSGVPARESAGGKEIDDQIAIREEQEDVESPTAELLEKGPIENLLYGSFDLITPKRKRTQRCLLYTQLQLVREAFNKEFVALETTKDSIVDKIKEMYMRVVELQKKLNLNDDFKLPNLNRQDDFNSVFTVKDEEIKAPNYSSIKKNKGDDANDKKKLKQGFNDAERALQDMMGGKIERKKEEVIVEAELEKPAWMLGNPKNFTKEQIKEIKEFDAKLKTIKEEKEKKQRAQEFEMRKLKNDIQDLMTSFDGSLLDFFSHRLQEEAKCLEIEENITRLSMEVEDEEFADERKESDLQRRLDNLKTTKGRSVGIVTEFKRQYEEFKTKYESALNEDKALDRNFKKDFQDCADLVPLLYRHYKKRKNHNTKVVQKAVDNKSSPKSLTRRGSIQNRSKSPGRYSMALNKAPTATDTFTEKPEEIEPDVWTRLLSARGRKINKEDEVRTLSEQMSKMDDYMYRLVAQDDLNRKRIERALRTLAEFREKREKRRRDLAILLHIKQGLVEIEINPLAGDYVDAALLPKTLIDEFNDVILREAHTKVKILIGMKDFKRGIYEIQWDIRRLQTLEKILIEKIRYIQLLRNTKALQAIIKNGVDTEKVVEDSSLEGRMEHLKGIHQKRVQEKKVHLEQLQNKVKLLQTKNVSSLQNAAALYQQYIFQARLCEKSLGKETNDSALKERLKGILAKQKAIDIAKEQVKTISSLEKDCDTWKNKSYPIIPPLPTPGVFNLSDEN